MQVHQQKELYLALARRREESREKLIKEVIVKPWETGSSRPETAAAGSGNEAAAERPVPGAGSDAKPQRIWPDVKELKGRIPRPVEGKIVGRFGRAKGPFNTYINRQGVVFQAKAGSEVRAVLAGEVIHSGWQNGYGNIIIIDHGQRYYTLIGGMAGLRHQAGQWVEQGQKVGIVPKGGVSEKKDIYFEIRYRGRALNPVPWLGKSVAG